jgi:AhpD family alkylhydroperoxidase
MTTRITDRQALQGLYGQMRQLEAYIAASGLERSLIHLVKLRASQINGCAFCMAMHTEEALEEGERVDRLAVVSAWREAPWYTEREQAALAWTESVTTLKDGQVPDEIFARAKATFGEKGLADLTLLVITINGWNRIAIPFHSIPKAFDHPAAPTS